MKEREKSHRGKRGKSRNNDENEEKVKENGNEERKVC